ncbi:MAG: molecular chaperone TorD family protein [Desulfobulbaceae bacterium]|nr:molecular chaperone TorD family protein [Desulfobulbaceae bacterium]HIJ90162.1 molecular chaperone TorD family protein [Deltaproteobacteria bacterium]
MTTDLMQAAQRQSDAYRLLAACFYQPDREMFVEENLCANLAGLMQEISLPAVGEACRRMAQSLAKNSQEELLVEYSGLFLGPFGAPAHPYGSVYLEQGRKLMGDSTMEVLQLYAESGVKHEGDEPPDHIAIELEFMSFLEGKIAQAISESNQAGRADFSAIRVRFFNRLLASWAPILGSILKEQATLAFYRDLGECLVGFISAEQQRLQKPALQTP